MISVMVAMRMRMWSVKGLWSELAAQRWHVIGVDLQVVNEDAGVVDCGGERI